MFSKKGKRFVKKMNLKFQRYANSWIYLPMLVLVAFLDAFLIVIPTDGILISSSMLVSKRWIWFALSVAIGSALGAFGVISLVEYYGMDLVLKLYPSIMESQTWIYTNNFFGDYGLLVLFLVGVTPLTQIPALVLVGLAKQPLTMVFFILLSSRVIKFLVMSYIATHFPNLIKKLWGVQNEVEEIGIK